MSKRLTKIISVLVVMLLAVSILATVVSANETKLGITNEEKGIETIVYTQDWSSVNDVNDQGVRTYGKGTVLADYVRFGDFANVVGAEANGNSYLQISRDPYVNGVASQYTNVKNSGTAYIDLPLNLGASTGNRVNNYATQLSLKDYVLLEYDITADKWVSEDANGNWTILTDDYVPGARASYPHLNSVMTFTGMTARYGTDDGTAVSWANGAGQGGAATTTHFNHQYGTWRVYATSSSNKGYFIYGASSDQVGGWLHVSTILDMSRVTYTAYDANGNVLTEVTPATVAYYTMDNPSDFLAHVFVNGAHVYSRQYVTFEATETVEGAYKAGTKISPEFDTGSRSTAKAATPNIALDCSRVIFTHHNSNGVEQNANTAWSIAIDNYAVTYYEDAAAVSNLKSAIDTVNAKMSTKDAKNGSTFKPTDATESIYSTSYKAPAAASYENSAILHTEGFDQESENIDIGNAGQTLIAEAGNQPGFDRGSKDYDGDYYTVTMGNQPTANDYLRFTRDLARHKAIENDAYANFRVGTYSNHVYSLAKFDYMTVDFEIMADQYVKLGESGNWDTLVAEKENGARAAYPEGFYFSLYYRNTDNAGATTANNGRFYLATKYIDGAWYLVDNVNGDKVAIPDVTNVWTHITQVVDVSDERITYTFNDNGTPDNKNDDYFVVNGLYEYGKVDIYVDGYYMTTWNHYFIATLDGMKLRASYDGSTPYPIIAMNDVRYNSSARVADSVPSKTAHSFGIDNFTGGVYYYKGTDSLAAYAADNKAPIYENDDAIFNKNYCYTYQPTGTKVTSEKANGATLAYNKIYATQAGALANVKEGESLVVGGVEPEFFYEVKFPFNIEIKDGAKLNWWSGGLEMGDDEYEPFEGYIIKDGAFVKVYGTSPEAEELFPYVSYNDFSGKNEISYRFFTAGSTPVLLDEIDPAIIPEIIESDNAFIKLQFAGFETVTLEGEYAEGVDLYAQYTPISSVQPLFNLTTTTSFTANFYIPWYDVENAEFVDVKIGGKNVRISEITILENGNDISVTAPKRFAKYKNIDGQLYKYATSSPGANGNNIVNYTVSFKADGVAVTQNFSIDLVGYFNKILAGNYTAAEKSLIMQAINYVSEVMAAVGKDNAAFKAILNNADYAQYLVTADTTNNADFAAYIATNAKSDVENLKPYLKSLGFTVKGFDGAEGYRPSLVFNVADEYVGEAAPFTVQLIYKSALNGQNATANFTYVNDANGAYYKPSADVITLFTYAESFTIRVTLADGTVVEGVYSIPADILAEGNTAATVEKALYAYALASLNYKNNNTKVFNIPAAN